jgi:hypothetical protein
VVQAAEILGITPRRTRRIRRAVEQNGLEACLQREGGVLADAVNAFMILRR